MKPSHICQFIALFCLSLLLAGCGRDKPQQLAPLADDAVILAFGDSLTHGTGAPADQAYPRVLAQMIQREVVIEATPGDKTSDAMPKLIEALDQYAPDLLLLCLGGNDFLRKIPVNVTKDNLSSMIDQALARGTAVMLLSVPKPALIGMKAHPLYQQLAMQYQLPLENEVVAQVLSDRATKADPIHPNSAGYHKIAEALARLLRQTGAIDS